MSSFIQFIQIALGGKNIPEHTEGEGQVITDKDGNKYALTVKVKDGKSTITVKGPDGNRDSRKGAIASLVGAMDFDINEFVRLSETEKGRKEQVKIFKDKFIPKEVRDQIEKYEANVKSNFDERTEVNRSIKELEGAIAIHPLRNENLDAITHTDLNVVYAELKKANEKNAEISRVMSDKQNRIAERNKYQSEINDLIAKVKAMKDNLAKLDEAIANNDKWLTADENQPPVQKIAELEKKIADASTNNTKFEQAKQLTEKRALLDECKKQSGELSEKINAEREAIENAIREMDSPVEGLSFDDDQLLYNGVPVSIDSLSTSEIIELGIRLKMAENPDLGVLFIQHGESIGADRLKLIKEIADRSGWQIIMEQVVRGKDQLAIEFMVEPENETANV